MSDATITGILAAIPPTLVALSTFIQGWRTSAKAVGIAEKTETIVGKSDTIIQKADEIHTLTNSNLDKLEKKLALSEATITALQRQVDMLISRLGPPPPPPTPPTTASPP